MADYNISAEITANTKGFESGVKKAQTASKNLGKSISNVVKGFGKGGLTGALTSAGLALGGIGIAVGATVKAVKGLVKVLDDCSEAYKVQLNAERALDTAINNSPYVTGTASKRLKEFASEMQKVSNLGDEEIIPQMTQLIATGRTEAEVMKIIATASDMSASGAMSFDQAVTQLNATLNGNIGRLGQQNAELKGLTEEELKSGKAVEILGEKYKGLAKATVDTKTQLKNAIGDLKETFGSVFENAMAPMRKFFTDLIQGWADARKAKQEYEQSTKDVAQGKGDIEDYQNVIAGKQKELEDLKSALNSLMTDDWGFPVEEAIRIKNEEIKQAERELEILKAQLDNKIEQQEIAKKQAEEENKRIETEKTVADLKGEYLEKIAEQERKWKNIKDVTGEQVSNEEKIKFYQDSLVDLMTQAGGQITTNNQLYKDQMAIIEKLSKDLAKPTEELEKQKKVLADIVSWEMKLRQQSIEALSVEVKDTTDYEAKKRNLKEILSLNLQNLQAQQEADLKSVEDTENVEEAKAKITEYYNNEKLSLQKDYNEEIADLTRQEEEETWKAQKEGYIKLFATVKSYAEKIGSLFTKMGQTIGNVFKNVVNSTKSILQKLFKGSINDLLDELLKFEDGILTFFVETLPQLPKFFESALQSISVMLESILGIVTPEKISEIITGILQTIQNFAPAIIGAIAGIITNMLDGIINSLPQILDTLNVVVEKLAEVLPQLIQKLIDLFIGILQEPDKIADLVVTIIKGILEIFKVLMKNIGPLLEALLPAIGTIIVELIKALPDFLASMGEALWEAVKGIGKFIVNMIIDVLNGMFDVISKAWTWIPGAKGIPHIPKLATGTDNAQRGLAIVGEAGPELVNFRGGEQVLNNRNTQKALAGIGGSSNEFTVNFYNTKDTSAFALVSQFKQYNRELAINGVI